jgi:homopolymeric O-antigen transport system ATP-binding protein
MVRVSNLAKAYSIWSSPAARLHGPLLGRLGQMPFLPSRVRASCQRWSHQSFKQFWALRNVSFEVRRGQCLGIIGQNGSGKSTLLQLIAGTLEPTEGSIEVNGRITALLELGSGFNPEFTGRENVFLNGAVLGLTTEEVRAKFDTITAFADIGDFIEQPTKTYSSGMTVRLAFAVQAVLNQDVLIVDEALSVGDEAFQRKCFSRIEQFRANGGTILFVSHGAGTVVELCEHVILLDRGEMIFFGGAKEVVTKYHKLLYAAPAKREDVRRELIALRDRPCSSQETDTVPGPVATTDASHEEFDAGMQPQSTVVYADRGAKVEGAHVATLQGRRVNQLVGRREYLYKYRVRFDEKAFKVRFGMLIKTISGWEIGGAVSHSISGGIHCVEAGQIAEVTFRFRALLQPGVYFLNAGVLGLVNGEEVYLARCVDITMFRIQNEPDLTITATVDFCVESKVELAEDPALITISTS